MKNRIVIITGCPGTGKSTVAKEIAASSKTVSVHLHTDDFYEFIANGYISPALPESNEQNKTVISAFHAAALKFADGGYETIIDGIITPKALTRWIDSVGYEVHYIVLRADYETTLARALGREKLNNSDNARLVEAMWWQFQELGKYEEHTIDTTNLSIEQTVDAVRQTIESKCNLPGDQ